MKTKLSLMALSLLALLGAAWYLAPTLTWDAGFTALDVSGSSQKPYLALLDASGRTRTLADYRGQVVTVFFGYTHCPDFCPTTLGRHNRTRSLLGDKARDLVTLFVSVDPERDQPALLQQYLSAFDPSYIGLSGPEAALAEQAKSFGAFYARRDLPSSALGYAMDHSTMMYVFDKKGQFRLVVKPEQSAESLAKDLAKLL